MVKRYLMTHSLLSSWLYVLKENPYEDATTEKDPMAEFMQTLRREPTPTTEAMQKGIDFEDLTTAILTGQQTVKWHERDFKTKEVREVLVPVKEHKWLEPANAVAEIIRGGQLQYRARKLIRVGTMDLVLYGRLDALKAGTVYDIKFSGKYERGKYTDSTQHPVYLKLIPEAEAFTYLVSNGTELWTETYRREETRDIEPIIYDFLDWLYCMGLMDLYREKWLAK